MMDNETLKTRLLKLMQKSRQAYRLYDSMGRTQKGEAREFTEMQAAEWRAINAELIKQLSGILDHPQSRTLIPQIFTLRNRLWDEFRSIETTLHLQQKDLLSAAEKGDFVKTAMLSRELVIQKARLQATQAAHHEIDEVIVRSRLTPPPILLTESKDEDTHTEPVVTKLAKVIPLRKA